MSYFKDDYIKYRISKFEESYEDAKLLAKNNRWNGCVNRLYYACFYSVSALLLKNKIKANTHAGLKSQFNLHFVLTGKISEEQGKLFTILMNWRSKGDYSDVFDFDRKSVEPLIGPVEDFIKTLKQLINL